MSNYIFTDDFFSHNISHWLEIKKYLNAQFGENLRCLELGTYEGRSAIYLMDNFIGDETLTVIDYFSIQRTKKIYYYNINLHSKKNQVITIEGSTFTELPKLFNEKPFHFIYIDAGKTSADNLFNLIVSERLLELGGIIVVDDYEWKVPVKEDKHKPKPGICAFKEISLLCEVFMEYYQIAFKKIKDNTEIKLLNR